MRHAFYRWLRRDAALGMGSDSASGKFKCSKGSAKIWPSALSKFSATSLCLSVSSNV